MEKFTTANHRQDRQKELRRRSEARGPNDELLSLLAGDETVDEIKRLIIHLCQSCLAGQNHPHCPFRALSGVSYASLTRLVQEISHESCLNLFDLELHCRSRNDSACDSAARA